MPTDPRLGQDSLAREWRVRRIYKGKGGITGSDTAGPYRTEDAARQMMRDSLREWCDEAILEVREVGEWVAAE